MIKKLVAICGIVGLTAGCAVVPTSPVYVHSTPHYIAPPPPVVVYRPRPYYYHNYYRPRYHYCGRYYC